MTVADYIRIMEGKGYNYGKHWFPHDAFSKRMQDGKSVVDFAREYGVKADRCQDVSVIDGINQVRKRFPELWFNEETTHDLVNALSQYRREWDEKKQTFRANPLHDWTSHAADAFRYMAISIENPISTTSTDVLQQRLDAVRRKKSTHNILTSVSRRV
ncbi:MAG: hypothetical protein DRN90_08035 [Thermoproteota archaeon]|nr:MAG: hypothetical protein DRN90_08035 [Candidatus Korarchaeota archaeon]